MSKKINSITQWLFLSVLTTSLVVACGKQDARKRVANPGQKTTEDLAKEAAAKKTQTPGSTGTTGTTGSTGGSQTNVTQPTPPPPPPTPPKAPAPELMQKLEQVDHILIQENGGKSVKAALQNNAALLKQIAAINLSINGDANKAQFEVTMMATKKEIFKSEVVKADELDNKDIVLKSDDGDQEKQRVGEVKLRRLPTNDYLLRIIKSENEILGLIYVQENSKDLKLTQVLGSEEKNVELLKIFGGGISDFNARADKLQSLIAPVKVSLEEVRKSTVWGNVLAKVQPQHEIIVEKLNRIEANVVGIREGGEKSIRAAAANDGSAEFHKNQALDNEKIGMTNVETLRQAIVQMTEVLRAEINTQESPDIKNGIVGIINTLSSIKLPGSEANPPANKGLPQIESNIKEPKKLNTEVQ